MSPKSWVRGVAVVGLAAAVLTSCTAFPVSEPPSSSSSNGATPAQLGEATVVTDRLEAPWSVAFREETALISERDSARILELGPDGSTRVVGTVPGVEGSGEGGLLGIAVDQDYLYAYSTGADGNRLQRFELAGEAGALELGPVTMILDGIPSASTHNGGRIAFGPDGMLYATVGDAGNRQDAQDLDSLSGKILRMTPDGDVPPGNPFPDSLVYSYGHRNPQGIAWAEDGTLYASEFGQNTWDELNVIEAGGNYGWPSVEGMANDTAFIDPVQQWRPEEASPSGIAITGSTLYIANLRGQRLRAVPLSDLASSTEHFVGVYGRLRDVTVAPDGSLWILTNNTDGRGEPAPDDDKLLSADP